MMGEQPALQFRGGGSGGAQRKELVRVAVEARAGADSRPPFSGLRSQSGGLGGRVEKVHLRVATGLSPRGAGDGSEGVGSLVGAHLLIVVRGVEERNNFMFINRLSEISLIPDGRKRIQHDVTGAAGRDARRTAGMAAGKRCSAGTR